MYAPATQPPGSSVSHFDTALTPDEQQEPSYTGADHTVGLSRQLLCDIGWCNGNPVDVFLLSDLGQSFADDLAVMKQDLPAVIDNLGKQYDLKIGLVSYVDYSISHFGITATADYAYKRDIDLSSNYAPVKTTLAGLSTKDGGDLADSQLSSLYYAATGLGQDLSAEGFANANIVAGQNPAFRASAEKLFLLVSDTLFHNPGDPGASFSTAVNAILKLDPVEVASIIPGGDLSALQDATNMAVGTDAVAPIEGIDCNNDGLLDVTGGKPIVCSANATGAGFGNTFSAVVRAAFALAASIYRRVLSMQRI